MKGDKKDMRDSKTALAFIVLGIICIIVLVVLVEMSHMMKSPSQSNKPSTQNDQSNQDIKKNEHEISDENKLGGESSNTQVKRIEEDWDTTSKYVHENSNIKIASAVLARMDGKSIKDVGRINVTAKQLTDNIEDYYGYFISVEGVPQYGEIYSEGSNVANKIADGQQCGKVIVLLDNGEYLNYFYIGNISPFLEKQKMSFIGLPVGVGRPKEGDGIGKKVEQIVLMGK